MTPSTGPLHAPVGGTHTCALGADGQVRCWGNDASNQIGNGRTLSSASSPYTLSAPNNAVALGTGRLHTTCAVTAAGTVYCWGNHNSGETGSGVAGGASVSDGSARCPRETEQTPGDPPAVSACAADAWKRRRSGIDVGMSGTRRRPTVTETGHAGQDPLSARAPAATCVRIVSSPASGLVDRLIAIDRLQVFGRHGDGATGIDIDDDRVSTAHLALYPDETGQLAWRDTNSKNGTFVNGLRRASGQLVENDVVRIGSTFMVVTRPVSAAASALADPSHDLVGRAPAFIEALELARLAATGRLTALVLGASGTGKEGLARLVHRASGRGGPFVAVNCATLVGDVANATLFGHARGAFTGAVGERQGLFRAAQGGTLFLDEVGELGLDIQARLLRALEQREIVPVGTEQARPIDVQFVAATNADLQGRVADGSFRGDLLARLSGVVVRLPPLCERREDILMLARHFGRRAFEPAHADRPTSAMFTPDAVERMLLYRWPFNVRELRQLILRLVLVAPVPFELSALGLVDPPGLATRVSGNELEPPAATTRRLRQRPSRDELVRALAAHDNNLSAVAREFDRDRRQIYRWLEQYGIGHDEPE